MVQQLSNQLYPPEPPVTFPASNAMAEQLYPPEPTVTFPALSEIADQPYPPEPPVTFPPPPPGILIGDLAGDITFEASPPQRANVLTLRAEAQALTTDDLSMLSVGHASGVQQVNQSQLYATAGGLLVVVVAVLVMVVARRREKKTSDEQSVVFSDSYAPFLG